MHITRKLFYRRAHHEDAHSVDRPEKLDAYSGCLEDRIIVRPLLAQAVVRGFEIPSLPTTRTKQGIPQKWRLPSRRRAVRKRKIDPALFGVGLRYQSALLYFVGDSVSANFAGKPPHRAL
jgi:hypothetical protein